MDDLNIDHCLLIVTGAHLIAERDDRPLAYDLAERVRAWRRQVDRSALDEALQLQPLVCSDLWYLNNDDLHAQPTITIGEPGVNAASAYLSNRLPEAFIIDQSLRIQLDQEFIDLKACIWGVSHEATAAGVAFFADRYLDSFLRAAHEMPAG